jgi:hypothetical protein
MIFGNVSDYSTLGATNMAATAQREVRVELDGVEFVGQVEEHGFSHGGHEIVVYYRGKTATDRVAPEVYYPGYVDFTAELLLKKLILEDNKE